MRIRLKAFKKVGYPAFFERHGSNGDFVEGVELRGEPLDSCTTKACLEINLDEVFSFVKGDIADTIDKDIDISCCDIRDVC